MLIIRSSIMTEFERNFYTLPKIGAVSMATFTVTNTNDSGAGSLRQAITSADASTGKNIINFCGLFDDGLAHTISLTGSGLSITDDISIQGRNPNLLTISDDSASRVFDITSGATATINGLTITNTYNIAINSENAVGGGGGISNEGVLTLNNSIITGNTASGNVINFGQSFSEGGGIYNSGSLTVNHSTISNNSVDGNSVENEGGGIYNIGSLIVNHSTISNNSATIPGFGSGIYNDYGGSLTVNNSLIISNNASLYGGGIYNNSSLTVNNSLIISNNAGLYGGGILNDGGLTVNNSLIGGNTAGTAGGGAGGGIYSDLNNSAFVTDNLTVNNSTITGNSAQFGGGIFSVVYEVPNFPTLTITVSHSTISGNTALEGGGILNVGHITDFSTARGEMDALYYDNLTVSNSIISDNHATTGGGIYNNGTLSVSNSSISNNYASEYGGGIYNSSSDGTGSYTPFGIVTISYSSISGNTAGTAGGGIYNNADDGGDYTGTVTANQLGDITVSYSTIADNQAHFGGGIYNDGILTVGNSTIKHNKAFGIELSSGVYQSGDGGGIYNNSTYGTTTVDYSTIAFNFDTCQEYSNYRISPDDIAGNFINNGYNWIGTTTSTTVAGDAA
jgi:hypothetical protein